MAEQFSHSATELRAIADLVVAMNAFEATLKSEGVGIESGPEIYWADRMMGHIERLDAEDSESEWCYRPARDED